MITEQTSADEDHEMELKAAENPQKKTTKNVTHKPCEALTNDINNKVSALYSIT